MAPTNQEVDLDSSALASVCELVSKLDRKRYAVTLKTDDGIINLQIVDKTVKNECVSSHVSSSIVSQLHQNDATTRGKNFAARGKNQPGRGPYPRGRSTKRHQNKTQNSAISDSKSAANLDSKSKAKYKSPSEKGRDNKRLNEYLYVKNRPATSDTSCQTLLLESSDKLTQLSPELCDTHCQTSPSMCNISSTLSSPTQTENSAATPWFAGCLDGISVPAIAQTPSPASSVESHKSSESEVSRGSFDGCRHCYADTPVESELPENLPPLVENNNPKLAQCGLCRGILQIPYSALKVCSKCHDIAYCCRECQSQDWTTTHARQCGLVSWEYRRRTTWDCGTSKFGVDTFDDP